MVIWNVRYTKYLVSEDFDEDFDFENDDISEKAFALMIREGNLPFIPQVGMSEIHNELFHRFIDITWIEQEDLFEVDCGFLICEDVEIEEVMSLMEEAGWKPE